MVHVVHGTFEHLPALNLYCPWVFLSKWMLYYS